MNHDKSQWPITSDFFAQTRKMPSNGGSGYFVCCLDCEGWGHNRKIPSNGGSGYFVCCLDCEGLGHKINNCSGSSFRVCPEIEFHPVAASWWHSEC